MMFLFVTSKLMDMGRGNNPILAGLSRKGAKAAKSAKVF